MVSDAVTAGVTTLVSKGTEKVLYGSNESWDSILVKSGLDAVEGTALGGATRLNKVTVGRGNMAAVYRGGLSKIRNKNASKMSAKVFGKGIVSVFTGSFLKSVSSGIKQHFLRW